MENKHPSEWTELPEGVYPVGFMVKGDKGDSDVYDVTSPRHAVWKECPEKLELWKNNDRVSIGRYALLTMVEFNNGWIWESAGRGWRHKYDDCDSPEPLTIPLREKVYGRDTHAALMDAHRKRQETKLPDAARGLIRSLCGDVRVDEGVVEK